MNQVYVLTCIKSWVVREKYEEYNLGIMAVGDSRESLLQWLQGKYSIPEFAFVKDPKHDFPWFTDGGFKYIIEDSKWKYEFICHIYEILKTTLTTQNNL